MKECGFYIAVQAYDIALFVCCSLTLICSKLVCRDPTNFQSLNYEIFLVKIIRHFLPLPVFCYALISIQKHYSTLNIMFK